MEKLGVVLEPEPKGNEKLGSKGKVCPMCGESLSAPQFCDSCGTKPFEKRPKK